MPKRTLIIILALIVAAIPYLGFPGSWESAGVALGGIAIVILTVDWRFLRRKKRKTGRRRDVSNGADTYVESAPARQPEDFKSESRFL